MSRADGTEISRGEEANKKRGRGQQKHGDTRSRSAYNHRRGGNKVEHKR